MRSHSQTGQALNFMGKASFFDTFFSSVARKLLLRPEEVRLRSI